MHGFGVNVIQLKKLFWPLLLPGPCLVLNCSLFCGYLSNGGKTPHFRL